MLSATILYYQMQSPGIEARTNNKCKTQYFFPTRLLLYIVDLYVSVPETGQTVSHATYSAWIGGVVYSTRYTHHTVFHRYHRTQLMVYMMNSYVCM